MARYTVTTDFTANPYFSDKPNPNARYATKSYKVGDILNAEIKTNFALQKILVSDGGYRIPQQNVKYLDGNIDPVYTTDTAATGKGNGVTGVLTPLFNSPSTTTASGFNWLKWGIIAVILYFVYKNIK